MNGAALSLFLCHLTLYTVVFSVASVVSDLLSAIDVFSCGAFLLLSFSGMPLTCPIGTLVFGRA